ncbi:MAG: sulfite exporter TauE/SafE family protein [Dehalococcoidia bacterium]|nr:sulfite exporter TauE/SafE family protein [Dehalococcoidia bacterium]
MLMLILVAIGGALAQFVDGSMGMGYGTTSASVLVAAGFLPALVSASVHTAETFTTFVGGVSHLRMGNVDRKIVLPLAASGVVGGIIGAYILATLVSGASMRPIVGAILLVLGVRILLKSLQGKVAMHRVGGFSKKLLLPLGFVAGAVDAIGGGGWGPIATSTLVSRNQTTPRKVVGSVILAEFAVTLAITLTFVVTLGFQNFLWHITLPLLAGGVLVAPFAAWATRRVPAKALGVAVGLLLVALNLRTVLQYLSHSTGFTVPVPSNVMTIVLVGLIGAWLIVALVLGRKTVAREPGLEAGD